MINPVRHFFCVTLVFSLLSANGLYFAPLLNVNRQSGEESASMQNCCCCCNSGGGMSSTCCCASRHSGRNDHTTCSVSSAPCAAPLAALSPNVLDQGIAPQDFALNKIIVSEYYVGEIFRCVRRIASFGQHRIPFTIPRNLRSYFFRNP
jgi:hypothetical protein